MEKLTTHAKLYSYIKEVVAVTWDTWDEYDAIMLRAYADASLSDDDCRKLRTYVKNARAKTWLTEVPIICATVNLSLYLKEVAAVSLDNWGEYDAIAKRAYGDTSLSDNDCHKLRKYANGVKKRAWLTAVPIIYAAEVTQQN